MSADEESFNPPSIEEIKAVFFRAMLAGWAGTGSQKGTIAEMPGSKTIEFVEGDFRVLDCYTITTYSNHSFGTTTIYYKGQLVWYMSYGGWYCKTVILFLKKCLIEAYEKGLFNGGRGVAYQSDDTKRIFYSNIPNKNRFEDFDGVENILLLNRVPDQFAIASPSTSFGTHWYRGGTLFYNCPLP